MKVLTAAYFEFIKNLRDVKMFLFLVIVPIVTTLILGTVIQGYFSEDTAKRINIGYVNEDNGTIGKTFDEFLNNHEVSKRLQLVIFNDKNEGEKAVDDGKVDTMIYLPSTISENTAAGVKSSIQVYGKKNLEFVESILKGYTSSYNTAAAVIKSGGKLEQNAKGESAIKRITFSKEAAVPKAMDYYSVLTLLQMLIVGSIFGVFITSKNFGTDLHIRMHSLPVRREAIIFGRVIGSTAYVFLGAIITMLFTKFAYGANYTGNIPLIIAAILLFSIIVVGIGVLLGLITSSYSTALIIVLLIMIFFGTFSGAVSPDSANDTIARFTPNYYGKIMIFGAIYGYSKEVIMEAAAYLAAMAAVIYALIGVSVRRLKNDNI